MKKMIFTLVFSLCAAVSLSAMNYEEAREQARFLTDKMAYELNLNEQQYNDCYEINLDYLLSVRTEADLYGDYLTYRNSDLRHILYDWQYTLFAAADYFFRPLTWYRGAWLFPIYRYYSLGHYYYHYPSVYYTYRGGHGRYYHRGGYYYSRRPHWNGGFRGSHRGAISHRGHAGHPSHRPDHGPSRHGDLSHHGSPSHHGGAPSHRGGDVSSRHDGASSHRSSSGTYHMGTGSSNHLDNHSSGSRPNMDARAQGRSGYSHPSSTRTTVSSVSHHSSSLSGRSSASSHHSFSGAATRSSASHSGGRASFGGSRGGSSHGGGFHGGGGSHRGGGRGR